MSSSPSPCVTRLATIKVHEQTECRRANSSEYDSDFDTIVQVAEYLDEVNGTASPNAIYFLFVGSNDYFPILTGMSNATIVDVLEATAEAVDMLYQAGARV